MTRNWGDQSICLRAELPLRDLDRLEGWASRSFMKFSKDKCQVLRLGRNPALEQYRMGNSPAEKNLMVLVDNKLNIMSQQRALAAKKAANSILGYINRNMACR